ncbi:MAG: hypothetical protein KME16_07950 [Scytolyngbya sp. HA4215-MV1]|jgi:hypothetical protein|nr:hypothetical protein [Scytolyngbya sp. HA4215-MV1]
MPKVIYDVIQRFEVENSIPRLIATNIQVIQGGDDLMSLAIELLVQLGCQQKFQENRTSQYLGYRLKEGGKGAKRYQLVLTPRKDGLCISLPKSIWQPHILEITESVGRWEELPFEEKTVGRVWIRPSREDRFLAAVKLTYGATALKILNGELAGNRFCVYPAEYDFLDRDGQVCVGIYHRDDRFRLEDLGSEENYLALSEDQLFPYTWQVTIRNAEVLRELLSNFAKFLMEDK